jgi:hypothetical protein
VEHQESDRHLAEGVSVSDSAYQYSLWEEEELLPATTVLLEGLPFDLYPYATARSYPHVLNVLASHWANRRLFIEAAAAFLQCRDWPRRGFPRVVFFEILGLVAHHGSLPDLGVVDMKRLNLRSGDESR